MLLFCPYKRLTLLESCLHIWVVTLFIDEAYQFLLKSGGSLRVHLTDTWNKVDATKLSLLLIAGVLRLIATLLTMLTTASLTAESGGIAADFARHSRWVLSFGALACCARLFAMLSLQQDMGVLFLSVCLMMNDIMKFLALLSLAALGFGLCMAGILNSTSMADVASPWKPFLAPFWAIHGHVLGYEESFLEFPVSLSITFWVYFMLSQVVLLNLLIAIMGDTWQRVKDSADEEWKFLLVQDMEEFFDLHPVPPPFNALILLHRIHNHTTGRASLSHHGGRRSPLLSASDLKKKSKIAQHELLRKQAAEKSKTIEAQLAALAASQLLATERMEKLAAATGHTQRAVNQLQDLQQQQQQQQLANNNTQGASFGSTPGGAPPMLSRARWGSSFMGPGTGMYV